MVVLLASSGNAATCTGQEHSSTAQNYLVQGIKCPGGKTLDKGIIGVFSHHSTGVSVVLISLPLFHDPLICTYTFTHTYARSSCLYYYYFYLILCLLCQKELW